MMERRRLEGLDFFRIIAALFVVAIHTSPFASFSANADFIFTRIIARCAVPFFLMITGYFTLPQYLFDKSGDLHRLFRFLQKSLYLYITAVILYLPINLYAGHFNDVKISDILRMLVFDGTFYHLWYLPASMLGIIIVFFLSCRLPFRAVMGICLILYFIGLAGDSYYGLVVGFPPVCAAYDKMFNIFSYTRNGIFYAPVFLAMGAGIKHNTRSYDREPDYNYNIIKRHAVNRLGFILSLTVMLIEGMLLHGFNMQRHDSMYIALLPCMFFLFQLILGIKSIHLPNTLGQHHRFRIRYHMLSMWLYIIHPLMIIAIHGIAKLTHLGNILVDNSLIHYIAVCIFSCAVSLIFEIFLQGRTFACTKKEERG